MKVLISCIVILLAAGMFNASSAQDTIRWSPHYKLKWSDFTGLPDTTSGSFALTSSGIRYKYSVTDTLLTFSVVAFFDKKHSWKIAYATDALLDHEQLHFDITEVYARKLKAELAKLRCDKVTVRKAIADLVQRIIDEKDAMQTQYDNETDLGRNVVLQKLWRDRIEGMLR